MRPTALTILESGRANIRTLLHQQREALGSRGLIYSSGILLTFWCLRRLTRTSIAAISDFTNLF